MGIVRIILTPILMDTFINANLHNLVQKQRCEKTQHLHNNNNIIIIQNFAHVEQE